MNFRLFKRASPALAAGAAIVASSTGRILLQLRAPHLSAGGAWSLVGGGVEPGETLEQAVFREIEEEAGLKLSGELQPLHIYKHRNFRYYSFILRIPDELEPKPNSEAQGYAWVTPDALPAPLHYGLSAILPKLRKILSK